jgi:hypothetical protein
MRTLSPRLLRRRGVRCVSLSLDARDGPPACLSLFAQLKKVPATFFNSRSRMVPVASGYLGEFVKEGARHRF